MKTDEIGCKQYQHYTHERIIIIHTIFFLFYSFFHFHQVFLLSLLFFFRSVWKWLEFKTHWTLHLILLNLHSSSHHHHHHSQRLFDRSLSSFGCQKCASSKTLKVIGIFNSIRHGRSNAAAESQEKFKLKSLILISDCWKRIFWHRQPFVSSFNSCRLSFLYT